MSRPFIISRPQINSPGTKVTPGTGHTFNAFVITLNVIILCFVGFSVKQKQKTNKRHGVVLMSIEYTALTSRIIIRVEAEGKLQATTATMVERNQNPKYAPSLNRSVYPAHRPRNSTHPPTLLQSAQACRFNAQPPPKGHRQRPRDTEEAKTTHNATVMHRNKGAPQKAPHQGRLLMPCLQIWE